MIRLQVHLLARADSSPPRGPSSDSGILRIEVDGIDLAGGRLEGPTLVPLAALLEGLARLWRGASRIESIPFAQGGLELLIACGSQGTTLSLVSLLRPAHVVFQDIEVSLERLAKAAAACGNEVFEESDPSAEVEGLGRCLRALNRTMRHPPVEPEHEAASPTFLRSSPNDGLAFGFEIQDRRGRYGAYRHGGDLYALLSQGSLYLHSPDEPVPLEIPGTPYLLMRDLVDGALRLLQASRDGLRSFKLPLGPSAPALSIDLTKRSVSIGEGSRQLHTSPEAIARAIFVGALELVDALERSQLPIAAHPRLRLLADDAHLCLELMEERIGGHQLARAPLEVSTPNAKAARADEPLALGSMRRVNLSLGASRGSLRIESLHQQGARLWMQHAGSLHRYQIDRWEEELRLPLSAADEVALAGQRDPFFVLGDQGLACHLPDGRLRWRREAEELHRLDSLGFPMGRDAAFLGVNGASLLVLSSRDGEELFRFDAPTAHAALRASHDRLLAIAADNGIVYGIDAAGPGVCWKTPVAQPWERIAIGAGLLWGASTSRGTATVDGLDPATGRVLFRAELPLTRVGSLHPIPGGLLVAGVGGAGGELLSLGSSGKIRWRARPMLGETAPSIARSGGSIFARGDQGVCRIERGKVRWNVPCEAGGPPTLLRGLVALPGEGIAILDAASGRSMLDPARAYPISPDLFIQTRAGTLLSVEYEGTVVPLRLAGALAVLPSLR